MKQSSLALVGVIGTALLMIGLGYSVMLYADDPNDGPALMAMSVLSSTLMLFLIVFAVAYTRPQPSNDYMEAYQGVCSRCGQRFGDDGVCPSCGRHRPVRKDRSDAGD